MTRRRPSSAEASRKRGRSNDQRRSSRSGSGPAPADQNQRRIASLMGWPAVVFLFVIVLAYVRLFAAGFVPFDDDFQLYANPFLNPPTLQSVGRFWEHAYQQLYIPLAYTILAGIARFAAVPSHPEPSLGHALTLDPIPFHGASIALHVASAWVCFQLIARLTGRPRTAWVCALVFALHPLQVESVAWASELRGLTSNVFALSALYSFVISRQAHDRSRSLWLFVVSTVCVVLAMLCKPSAAILPLVLVVIDRFAFRPPWLKTWRPPVPGRSRSRRSSS